MVNDCYVSSGFYFNFGGVNVTMNTDSFNFVFGGTYDGSD
jgi:hypothetical protein